MQNKSKSNKFHLISQWVESNALAIVSKIKYSEDHSPHKNFVDIAKSNSENDLINLKLYIEFHTKSGRHFLNQNVVVT